MTVKDCIDAVDSFEPNAYDNEQKARWVRECEGKVYTGIFLQQPMGFHVESNLQILDHELAIPAPYNKIYRRYLQAMIHYHNGEYDRYSASMQLFNEAWSELCRWFGQDYDISDRARNRRITVRITGTGGEVREAAENVRSSSFSPSYFQTLMRVPERCAFVAGRIVVRRPFIPEYSDSNKGKVWFGNPTDYISAAKTDFAETGSSGIKVLIGDVGGTDLGIALTYEADGEAYLTGILCQPEEEFLPWPEIRVDAPPPVVFQNEISVK